jgi:hypothetical protein
MIGLGFGTGEADELVGADVAVLRDLTFLDHLKGFSESDLQRITHDNALGLMPRLKRA